MDSIIVRKLAEHEKVTAMQLSWDVFVEFDNTDCSEEGLRNFRNFIDDKEMVDSLDAYGAFVTNLWASLQQEVQEVTSHYFL